MAGVTLVTRGPSARGVPALHAAQTLALPLLAPNSSDQGHPMKLSQIASAFALAALSFGAAQAATVQTIDYIASPTHFNGFEGIGSYTDFGPTYTEDGITVTQVNGEANDIWTTYTSMSPAAGSASRVAASTRCVCATPICSRHR